jgi:malonyl-CoA O-methyltransferase
MRVSSEFSKHALHYDLHNSIQNLVIEKLLSMVLTQPDNILDLGCGSGALCKKIDWKYKHFTGVDFAPGMLELHPKSQIIECVNGNFNDAGLFQSLRVKKYDYIFSASALQWAQNLENTFKHIQDLKAPVALAIFTSNTFKTLNNTASLSSFLSSVKEVEQLQEKYFSSARFEVVNYKLEFTSVREMFVYIKRSGVSGSRNVLTFKETKKLMREYPLNYLEFEVAFITSA